MIPDPSHPDYSPAVIDFASQLMGQQVSPELQQIHQQALNCQNMQGRLDLVLQLRQLLEQLSVAPGVSAVWHNTAINLITDSLKLNPSEAFDELLDQIYIGQDDQLYELVANWLG